jgi:frataxin
MSDKNFHHLCDAFLEQLAEKLEAQDKNSELEIEYSDGILTINLEGSKTYVINRHSASQKIWYSSPFSGANYFSFNDDEKKWLDSKGEELEEKLMSELKNI